MAVPHASRPGIWVVVGHHDGGYANFTASRTALDALAVLLEGTSYFTNIIDALADMPRRDRS